MEHSYGQMEADMMESSISIILKVLDIIFGLMEDNIKVFGKIIKCMVEVCLLGQMEENMKENM